MRDRLRLDPPWGGAAFSKMDANRRHLHDVSARYNRLWTGDQLLKNSAALPIQ